MSSITVPTLRQLVTLGSEAWELVRETFATIRSEIIALEEQIAAATGGATIVATTNDLPDGEVTNGATYYVTSQRALYQSLNGVLVRTQTSPSWVSMTTWYVASTGTADAAGDSSGDPVTYAELLARLGRTKLTAGVTVFVLDDIDLPELTYFGDTEVDGLHWLYFEGVPTAVATGTIASSTDWDPSSNQDGLITGSSSLVAHEGKLLRITGGARQGALFWLAKNTTGATMRITQPIAQAWYSDHADPLQVGDPYEVLSLPHLADTVTVQAARDVEFGFLSLGVDGNPHTVNITCGGSAQFNGCSIYGFDADVGSAATLYACKLVGGMRAQGKASIYAFACMSDGAKARSGGKLELADHVSQDDRIVIEPGGELRNGTTGSFLAVYDYGGCAFQCGETSLSYFDGYIIGKGITGTIARMQVLDGAVLAVGHAPAIAGSGFELQVGGKSSGNGGTKLTFADVPWTHGGGGARIFVPGAAVHPTPRPTEEFENYVPYSTELRGATQTTTSPTSHPLSLSGTHARTIQVRLASSSNAYTGSWTITGNDVDGNVQTETLSTSDHSGDSTPILETKKTFAPGSFLVERTAMANTTGSYTINVGTGFGLKLKAYEGPTLGYGHLLSVTIEGIGSASLASSFAYIEGPTRSPPYGALVFVLESLDGMAGSTFQACFLAVN